MIAEGAGIRAPIFSDSFFLPKQASFWRAFRAVRGIHARRRPGEEKLTAVSKEENLAF